MEAWFREWHATEGERNDALESEALGGIWQYLQSLRPSMRGARQRNYTGEWGLSTSHIRASLRLDWCRHGLSGFEYDHCIVVWFMGCPDHYLQARYERNETQMAWDKW